MYKREPAGIAPMERGTARDRFRVAVERDHAAVGAIEQRRGVAAAPEGAVDIKRTVSRLYGLKRLLEENGCVSFAHDRSVCRFCCSMAAAVRSRRTGWNCAASQISKR